MRFSIAWAFAVAIAFVCPHPAAGSDVLSFGEQSSLPPWVLQALSSAATVSPCSCLNPFYQRADFDGDGHADYAVLVREPASGRLGIAFIDGRTRSVRVLGAGFPIVAGSERGEDFNWMDAWLVFERGPVARGAGEGSPPKLRGDALLVEKTGAASALLWWDGKRYQWYQQGD
jgi:hypothetical protein